MDVCMCVCGGGEREVSRHIDKKVSTLVSRVIGK